MVSTNTSYSFIHVDHLLNWIQYQSHLKSVIHVSPIHVSVKRPKLVFHLVVWGVRESELECVRERVSVCSLCVVFPLFSIAFSVAEIQLSLLL